MSGYAILATTASTEDEAKKLAAAALAQKLAACVQIFPIRSHYVWKGALCEEAEICLQMKIRAADYDALAALVKSLHSYETPEIIRIDVAAADPAYLAWIEEVTSSKG